MRLVGIGASAGGLDALGEFLSAVPPGCSLAFAVVQHLDPTHKAMLAELLQRSTRMSVREASVPMRVEAGHVYVIPPNKALTLLGNTLQLTDPSQPRGLRRPIDDLFESIAREQGDQAIGVVLSGMGSDGTAGLQAIHARGGLTLVQAPESAQFDAMPRSALSAGGVDIVALPADMPRAIQAAIERQGGDEATARVTPDAAALHDILDWMRQHGRHDFRLYKRSTLLRRIERRMGIHHVSSLPAYAALLRGSEQEVDLLCQELLIGVTAFFRDKPVWQVLQAQGLPRLLAGRQQPAALRAWVAGCSTGEEAYTLAMLFREVADATPGQADATLQIFATDLSHDAIETARRGVYPAAMAGELSAQRLARFFVSVEGGFRICKRIRESIVFATHDVTADPPFTRLDLLSCRNLLIYLTAPLQKRLLPLFHYSLRPGGLLLLGTSETVGRFGDLFDALDPRQRLYLRRDVARPARVPDFPTRPAPPRTRRPQELTVTDVESAPPPNLQAEADRLLLRELSPPAVLVNARGDIVYINGRTGRYLEPAAGKANWNIHVMAREGLRAALDAALGQAERQEGPVLLHALPLEGRAQAVDVTVQALDAQGPLAGMRLIVFREVPARRRRRAGVDQGGLAAELQQAREEAQALREEMRASQEELQASNEELQSTNEELQSTNEELTSSKEEMQSMNEELQAVNAELQSKLDDLALAQSDMRNLLNSTDIATLFLDKGLNVRRFTEKARKIISLRDSDIGRPLSDLSTQLEYPALEDDVRDMLRTMVVSEKEVHSRDGQWYAVRVMPYRTQDDTIQGAVITFVDITAAKALEARLRGGS